jgi:hypothetical protein
MNRKRRCGYVHRGCRLLAVLLAATGLAACTAVRPIGLVYTDIRLPLTMDLHDAPLPTGNPPTGRVLEVKEPISGFGIYARVDANAIGEIARKNGMRTLYFADRQIFSILGIWSTNKTILYGE